jgi:ABC-type lipoprotein release transport system permease subunit
VYGVDSRFQGVLGADAFTVPLKKDEAVISDNLATRLNVKTGDEILIRINKPGPVPIDAPFVSDEENIITLRVTIKEIAGKEQLGRFHLQNTQTAPFNVFISKKQLQELSEQDDLSNLILLAGSGNVDASMVEKALARNLALKDASLNLARHPLTNEWILRTPRVFFDPATLAAIEQTSAVKTLWFSYFVNEIRIGERTTPYSFVSTLPGNQIEPGSILINRWMADDLDVRPGDSLTLSYFMVGPLRKLTVEQARFRVSGIIPMEDPLCDPLMMPEIPGLSDAGNCRDWETSIPVDLTKIRDKDEAYWNRYRGTPKAFINAGVAAGLWENRFGNYTQIRFNGTTSRADLETGILSHLPASDIGFQVREPSNEGVLAASTGVDFSGLFLGLSFFLIAGGIILTILLIRLGMEGRITQIGTLRSLGWPQKSIRQAYLQENILVAVIGGILGLGLTFLYTILIFKALNGVWNDIVLTDTLRPVFKPGTLAAGLAISMVVSVGAAWLALTRFFNRTAVELLRKTKRVGSVSGKGLTTVLTATVLTTTVLTTTVLTTTVLTVATGMGAIVMIIIGLFNLQSISPTYFFLAGTLLLISMILLSVTLIRYPGHPRNGTLTIGILGRNNLRRNSGRSLSVILLFSIGIFMVIAIGANRKTTGTQGHEGTGAQGHGGTRAQGHEGTRAQGHEGTGGFGFYMETTVPVADNLNDAGVRAKYGLETKSEFVQMKRLDGDDASCLNLNRVSNPPLLGVPTGALDGRFTFASLINESYRDNPWEILDSEMAEGVIPAIADQTVIQWGLGLKIGDTLTYTAERGDTLRLVLMGGLANSIFQGNILISETHFIKHWTSVSGTNLMLVGSDPGDQETVQTEILRVFRDYGTDLKPAPAKLAEFNSVENTYLSIFLVMGALAMLLGTIGLAIVLVRSLQERRAEIALLRATGFSRGKILRLVLREYASLLFYGTLAGGIPALVAVMPALLNPAGEVSAGFLATILLVLLGNGLAWILILARTMIWQKGIVQSLRND